MLTTTCNKSGFTVGPLSLFSCLKTALRSLLPSPLAKKLLGNCQVALSFYCFLYLSPLPVVRASEGVTAKVAREKDIFNSESHKSTWRVQEAASLTAQVNKRISVLYFLVDVNGTPL